jgi:hypothetical protein
MAPISQDLEPPANPGRFTERADLLMQDVPDDLYAEALRQLGRGADDPHRRGRGAAQGVAASQLLPLAQAVRGEVRATTPAARRRGRPARRRRSRRRLGQDAGVDASDAEPPTSAKAAAQFPPIRRRLLGAALIALLLALACWAATLVLPR